MSATSHHRHAASRTSGRAGDVRRLAWALGVTATLMVAEVVGGFLANSLALLADGVHMLGDVGAIGLSLFAIWFATRPATAEKTFGFYRIEILAALANAAALMVIAGLIFRDAYGRLRAPPEVYVGLMLPIAVAGLIANLAALRLLRPAGSHAPGLALRGASLHVLGDLLGSLGTILAAVLIALTGWTAADPIISAGIGALIVASSWRLMRDTLNVLLEGVPPGLDARAISDALAAVPGVVEVHDLHVWSITSGFPVLTSHLVIDQGVNQADTMHRVRQELHDRYGITHATIQVEPIGAPGGTWVCSGDVCYLAGPAAPGR